jgi:outer membrane protein assembly factor BamB
MNNIFKKIVLITLPMFVLVACNFSKANPIPVVKGNYSLSESWSFKTDKTINALVAADGLIVIADQNALQTIRISDLSKIWTDKFVVLNNTALKISNGKLYAVNAAELRVYDLKSGDLMWRTPLKAEDGRPEILTVSANRIYLLRQGLWLVQAYEASSGAFLWEIPCSRGGVSITPNVDAKLLYVLGDDNINAYDTLSGKLVRGKNTDGVTGPGIYHSGILYYYLSTRDFPKRDGYIIAFNTLTQNEIWKTQTIPDVTSVTMLGNNLVVSTKTGIVAINPSNGQIDWRYLSEDEFQSPPLLIDGFIYAEAVNSKNIYALNVSDGNVVGYIEIGTQAVIQSPTDNMLAISQVNDTLIFSVGKIIYGYAER